MNSQLYIYIYIYNISLNLEVRGLSVRIIVTNVNNYNSMKNFIARIMMDVVVGCISAIQVQILHKTVFISTCANTSGKCKNPTIRIPAMVKSLLKMDPLTLVWELV